MTQALQALDISRIQPVSEEDLARADWYGLLARLFSGPLDRESLDMLAASGGAAGDDSDLAQRHDALAEAAAVTTPEQSKQEFDTVFIGTGKPEVFLNASYYQAGFLHEKPLVDLRQFLGRLGYALSGQTSDTEDHLSLLCGTMRRLILDREPIAEQRELFQRFIADWFEQACQAVDQCGHTDFYKHVARLAHAFLAIERQSFDFED